MFASLFKVGNGNNQWVKNKPAASQDRWDDAASLLDNLEKVIPGLSPGRASINGHAVTLHDGNPTEGVDVTGVDKDAATGALKYLRGKGFPIKRHNDTEFTIGGAFDDPGFSNKWKGEGFLAVFKIGNGNNQWSKNNLTGRTPKQDQPDQLDLLGVPDASFGPKASAELKAAVPSSLLPTGAGAKWQIKGPSDYDKQLGIEGTVSVSVDKGRVLAGTPKKTATALDAHFKANKLDFHVINTIHRGMEAHVRIGKGKATSPVNHMVKMEGAMDWLFKIGNGNNQWTKEYGPKGIYGQLFGLQNRGGGYSQKLADSIQRGWTGESNMDWGKPSDSFHSADARFKDKRQHDIAVHHAQKVLTASGFERIRDKKFPAGGGMRENWKNFKNGATATIDHDARGDFSPTNAVSVEILHGKQRSKKLDDHLYINPDAYYLESVAEDTTMPAGFQHLFKIGNGNNQWTKNKGPAKDPRQTDLFDSNAGQASSSSARDKLAKLFPTAGGTTEGGKQTSVTMTAFEHRGPEIKKVLEDSGFKVKKEKVYPNQEMPDDRAQDTHSLEMTHQDGSKATLSYRQGDPKATRTSQRPTYNFYVGSPKIKKTEGFAEFFRI